MNRIKALLAGLLLLITPLAIVATAAPAQAVEGCTSQVRHKANTWGNDMGYTSIYQSGTFNIRLVGTAVYWYCPNGTNPTKIKVRAIDWCWTVTNSKATTFDGVRFDAFFGASGNNVDPLEFYVRDDGTAQNCQRQYVSDDRQRWQKMSDNPAWSITAFIQLELEADHERTFRNPHPTGPTYKFIKPGEDVNLDGWFS